MQILSRSGTLMFASVFTVVIVLLVYSMKKAPIESFTNDSVDNPLLEIVTNTLLDGYTFPTCENSSTLTDATIPGEYDTIAPQ